MPDQAPSHIIDMLGGPAALAKALNVKPSAVSNWKLDGRGIPFKFRPAIARLAAERAINLPADYWQGMAA
jgi:DNA-binding transcriptional regulator YdaS (Cro superfamily)